MFASTSAAPLSTRPRNCARFSSLRRFAFVLLFVSAFGLSSFGTRCPIEIFSFRPWRVVAPHVGVRAGSGALNEHAAIGISAPVVRSLAVSPRPHPLPVRGDVGGDSFVQLVLAGELHFTITDPALNAIVIIHFSSEELGRALIITFYKGYLAWIRFEFRFPQRPRVSGDGARSSPNVCGNAFGVNVVLFRNHFGQSSFSCACKRI